MSVLTQIVECKRQQLLALKTSDAMKAVERKARERRTVGPSHMFRTALQQEGVNIIAEFKRRSPSKGIIRADVDANSMARRYEDGGAAAISVLTEEVHFAGSLDDLRAVKAAVQLPVLRKDFLFDEYQIYEAAAAGADAVLLIVASLNDETLRGLRQLAEDELGMDALVEVHDEIELNRAVKSWAKIIGVNNRNLHTFEVTLQTSMSLADKAPSGTLLISESGLKTADDLQQLRHVGYRGFLIGESLMRAENPEELLRMYRGDHLPTPNH